MRDQYQADRRARGGGAVASLGGFACVPRVSFRRAESGLEHLLQRAGRVQRLAIAMQRVGTTNDTGSF